MAFPSTTPPRHICVHRSEQLSPHLQRIYFSSEDFSNFPTDQNGAHIKLFFSEQAQLKPPLPYRDEQGKVVWPDGKKPTTRTYTIRDFLAEEQLLMVDFVRHADYGVAAHWAINAKPGQVIGLAGPGGRPRFNPSADYWIFIGDLSALPMIAASLELLPAHAEGEVWLEVENERDCIQLLHPTAVTLHWLIQDQQAEEKILASLAQLDWNQQKISVSLAGENSRVVSLLKVFKHQYKVAKTHLYAVPYWKKGHTEEAYHQERHHVMDNKI
ncbi:siderophore-interacting protein [Acinetobacter terrestris]|uniref:Siderophore-interacting protein n=1 Tax=Acinetobacter terrestris TaxID=2529843 RepID=A0ABX1V079_9GAMM|nr:siderophore-interacting protein [Acinetobacter terrestris]NNH27834.1 siderophore-interacting protein [Acinetobacter terrestris]TCB53408.1 siderophore-interacting protein [Acinetobacter terrestris]